MPCHRAASMSSPMGPSGAMVLIQCLSYSCVDGCGCSGGHAKGSSPASVLFGAYHFGHFPCWSLCLSAYFLSVRLNFSSAPGFFAQVLLICKTRLASIWAIGSRSCLTGVRVVQNLFALWLLFRDLKVSMTAALSLAIFAGASCVASMP